MSLPDGRQWYKWLKYKYVRFLAGGRVASAAGRRRPSAAAREIEEIPVALRRLVAWTAIPMAAALSLTACGGKKDEGSGGTNHTVQIGIAEPQFLTPAQTSETSGAQ